MTKQAQSADQKKKKPKVQLENHGFTWLGGRLAAVNQDTALHGVLYFLLPNDATEIINGGTSSALAKKIVIIKRQPPSHSC